MMDGRVKTLHPERAWRPARHSRESRARGRDARARHRADRPAGREPLSVRGDRRQGRGLRRLHREHRHRRPRDDPRGGEEPRRRRRRRRRRPTMRVVLDELAENDGALDLAPRKRLAQKAYARTAAYDAAISNWFAGADRRRRARLPRASAARLPRPCAMARTRTSAAGFYRTPETALRRRDRAPGAGQVALLQQRQRHRRGLRMRRRVRSRAHGGGGHHQARQSLRRRGRRRRWREAYARALRCDPVSAFGGIVALNRRLDAAGRDARSSRSSPRSSSRPTRTRRPSPSSPRRRTCACC